MTEKQIIQNEEAKKELYSILTTLLIKQTAEQIDLSDTELPF